MKSAPNFLKTTLSLLLVSFILPGKVLAQNVVGLTTMPPRVPDLVIEAGKADTREIKVRNDSNVDRYITTSIKDFVVTDDAGTPIQLENVDSDQNRWAASNWLQITPTKFKLSPGETKSLVLTVVVPENATPGGHYAMVLFSPDTVNVLNETGSIIQSNVATLVYVTVPGDIKQDAQVKSFSAPKFSEYGPIDFDATITNLSDLHITPAGSINITNMLGGKTAQLDLEETNIFPYTSRDFQNTLEKKWLFGRYKAQLLAAYGTQGQNVTATLFFWVIPWRLLILAITLIAIIVALVMVIRSKPPKSTSNQSIQDLEKELEILKNKYKDRR